MVLHVVWVFFGIGQHEAVEIDDGDPRVDLVGKPHGVGLQPRGGVFLLQLLGHVTLEHNGVVAQPPLEVFKNLRLFLAADEDHKRNHRQRPKRGVGGEELPKQGRRPHGGPRVPAADFHATP